MTPSTNLSARLRLAMWLTAIAVIVFSVYTLSAAIHTAHSTGILKVTSNKTAATVSISQDGHEAKVIGYGDVGIHLTPGTYHVVASQDGTSTTISTQVVQGKVARVALDFSKSNALPSVQNVDFENTDALTDRGIATGQLRLFKLSVFGFKPLAHKVVVDTGSIHPEPHNLAIDGGTFKTDFVVAIDGKKYNATLAYSGLDTAQLTLKDSVSGALVFDSGTK